MRRPVRRDNIMGVDGHKPLDGVLFVVRVLLVKRFKVCCCRCHLYLLLRGRTRRRVTRRRMPHDDGDGRHNDGKGQNGDGRTTMATGDTTTARVSRAMGSTTTVMGGMTMRHDDGNTRHDNGDGRQDNCKTYCSCTPDKWICKYFILTYLKFLWKSQFWRSILLATQGESHQTETYTRVGASGDGKWTNESVVGWGSNNLSNRQAFWFLKTHKNWYTLLHRDQKALPLWA